LTLIAAAGLASRREVNPCRIDISGSGQIRLTVYQQTGAATLLPGCTVWSGLMLLHLAEQGGRRRWLAVLPDSAPPDARRRLAVAVQALAEKA
jgi:toxin CptA